METYSSIQHIYIDLAVVHETTYRKDYSEHENYIRQMSSTRETISLDEIVQVEDNFTLITGIAGIGKSELAKKIVSKWRKGELFNGKNGMPNIQFLFFLKCRELNTIDFLPTDDYESILKKIFPKLFEHVTLDDLEDISDKSMIIIDGLDELMSIEELDCPVDITNYRIQKMVQFVRDILFSSVVKFQPKYKIAVGRPHIVNNIKRIIGGLESKLIYICGFNINSVNKYIVSHCDLELQQRINKEIELSKNLSAMSHIPVYLSVICSIYKEELKITAPRTSTELMMYACLVFIKRHMIVNRKDKVKSLYELCNRSDVMRLIKSISWMSFKSLYEKRILFVKEELSEIIHDIEELEGKTGFVVKSVNEEYGDLYQFSHLILHELFSGFHLFFSPKERLNYSVENSFSRPLLIINGQEREATHLENCFAVVACIEGIQKREENHLLSHFVKQLANVYQLSLHSKSLMKDMHKKIVKNLENNVLDYSYIRLYMRYVYESNCILPPELKNLIIKKKDRIDMIIDSILELRWNIHFFKQLEATKISFHTAKVFVPVTNLHVDDLNYLVLLLSNSKWQIYSILTEHFYEILLPQLETQNIKFDGIEVKYFYRRDLFIKIIPYFQKLKIHTDSMRLVDKHYISSNSQLKHLDISVNKESIEIINDSISHLTTLTLHFRKLSYILPVLDMVKSLKERENLNITSITFVDDEYNYHLPGRVSYFEKLNLFLNFTIYIPDITITKLFVSEDKLKNMFLELDNAINAYESKIESITSFGRLEICIEVDSQNIDDGILMSNTQTINNKLNRVFQGKVSLISKHAWNVIKLRELISNK